MKKAGVQSCDCELHLLAIKSPAFGHGSGCRTGAYHEIPHIEIYPAQRVFVCGFLFCILKKKEQVDVGMRKECVSAITAKRDDGHTICRDRPLLDQMFIAVADYLIYKPRASLDNGDSVSRRLELFPQPGQAVFIRFAHLAAGQKD